MVPLAEFTRVSQQNAALRKALGASKDATTDQLVTRITELKTPRTADDLDPAVAERLAQVREREWRAAERVYGPELTALVRQFADDVRTGTDDPEELLSTFHAAIGTQGQRQAQTPASTAPAVDEQEPAPQQTPAASGEGVPLFLQVEDQGRPFGGQGLYASDSDATRENEGKGEQGIVNALRKSGLGKVFGV